jgi:murein hydrolase activator
MYLFKIAFWLTLCTGLPLHASQLKVHQTQGQLKQLDIKIHHLQQTLATASDKRLILNRELSGTEKQIGTGVQRLDLIAHTIKNKAANIAVLQIKDKHLNKDLLNQQQLLTQHMRARYQMGEYQPLKWILNQDEPYHISRLLTYYQYLIASRQKLINQIDNTRKHIQTNREQLSKELAQNQQLKFRLSQHQNQLNKEKQYHTALIHTLNHDILDKQSKLQTFKKNKENLAGLLKKLSQQSVFYANKPFLYMRKKLPRPIALKPHRIQPKNQGVTFFAEEGTKVTAVYPGKVVFSDWLNGYGLLLIIDHGQGFMTLYAHNQSLFKKKGETVLQNEQIARIGHSGGSKESGLYFEIRQKGKAVPPLTWLAS